MKAPSFQLYGGLDMVTAGASMPPGRAIGGVNYEPEALGYARLDGFERMDGRPAPSAQSYWLMDFHAGSTAIAAGDVVTGGTSGATGIVLLDADEDMGTWGGGDATGFLVLSQVTGTFVDGEDLEVSAAKVAEADGAASEGSAATDELSATYLQASIEYARDQIAAVPGSGPVRAVWVFGANRYAIRDNVGGTAAVLHKSTAAGWSPITFGTRLGFDVGTAEFLEGLIVTGGTSGATGIIRRVVKRTGTWGSDAKGNLVLDTVVGTFLDNEALTASTGAATADGAPAAITLSPSGTYQFINHNFYGATNLRRCYFVNAVDNYVFEWDGTYLVPIATGTAGAPSRVAEHRKHLIVTYPGGSLQVSSTGNPHTWSALTGAAEIGLGEDVTDLLPAVQGVLIVLGRNQIGILYGNDVDDFRLEILADDAGGIAGTAQRMGTPLYMDDQGVRSLSATQAFGDFRMGTVTQLIHPLFVRKRKAGVTPVGSLRCRAKDQYRLYFSDGTGITIYFGRKYPEALPFDLGIVPTAMCSSEDADGNEVMLFGDADGMVYQIDKGTSFDGAELLAFIRLAFNHLVSPSRNFRLHKATLEVDTPGPISLGVIAEFDYADSNQPPGQEATFDVRGGGGFWNEANWDQFYWSSPVVGIAEAYDVDGVGRNVAITVISQSTYEPRHALKTLILHHTDRGLVK